MKVLVTGGTGFIGSHSVRALLAAGHDVRVLLRRPRPVPEGAEIVAGDATDDAAVAAALDGCDAVLNCVSMVSLRRGDAARVREVNVTSAELVLGGAADRGLDPIIHVSSVSALLPGEGVLTPDSPVGNPPGAYMQSKAEADRHARALQDKGAPVVMTYPTMVVGPDDPTMGEGMATIARVLRGRVPALPPGGMEIIDVRDVAAAHVAVMQPGRGPRRYFLTGHHRSARDLVGELRRITGRRLPVAPIPTAVASAACRVGELLPFDLPLTTEGLWVLTLDARSDDTSTRTDLGVVPRPLEETLRDIVNWLKATDRI
jgi:nucleoside-diphosphate-sugar epimerase